MGLSCRNLQNACDSVIASFHTSSCAGGGGKNCGRASEHLTVLYLKPKEIQHRVHPGAKGITPPNLHTVRRNHAIDIGQTNT